MDAVLKGLILLLLVAAFFDGGGDPFKPA